MHHIFPKALLYENGFERAEVNAVANFCFLTKDTNLQISARPPSEYFREIEARHPGALSSQWIPMDEDLWETQNYPQFLEERQRLLAGTANTLLEELLHDTSTTGQADRPSIDTPTHTRRPETIPGGIEDEEEEEVIKALNAWVRSQGLPEGHMEYELAHPESGEPLAILDLALAKRAPRGLQQSGGTLARRRARDSADRE